MVVGFCLSFCCISSAQQARQLFEVEFKAPEELIALLEKELDVWEAEEHRALVYVTEEERLWIRQQGYTLSDKSSLLKKQLSAKAVDGYYTFDEYVAAMNALVSAKPDIVSNTSLGQSWEGRDIWMLKISDNVAVDEDEPEVLLLSLQHAREWLGGMTLLGITERFVNGYETDATVTELINTMELFVILVCNPDGYVYTHTSDRLWRRNRRSGGGVDLNRNFSWQWGVGNGGPAPLSEPETVALKDFIVSRDKALVGCLNYHTYNTRVMHSWAYSYELPPNVDVMGPLARDVALAIEAVNGQRMRNGSWAITLNYIGGGTTNDYLNAERGIPCFQKSPDNALLRRTERFIAR